MLTRSVNAPARTRRALVPLFAILAIAFGVLATSQLVTAVPRPNPISEPWPSFMMIYRETRSGFQGPIVQTFRLDYQNARDFSSTLIAHSHEPRAVGYTNSFKGNVSTTTDPRLGTRSEDYGPYERTVPSDWLAPASTPSIVHRPGAQIMRAADGIVTARLASIVDGLSTILEVRYREVDGIPLLVTEQVNGKEVRRLEVLELQVVPK